MSDLYRRLFESNPRPMWVFDRATLAFLIVNDAACGHYGWTRDELLAMTLPQLWARDGAAALGGDRIPRTARHVTRAGAVIEVQMVDVHRDTVGIGRNTADA